VRPVHVHARTELFHRLHKWAHRQDENFLTESLALVLEHLLALAPAVGTRLISKLTGGFIDVPPQDASTIELQTQVEAVAGRPDLEIRVPHKLAWIEVKAESELRKGQLEGYRVLLRQAGVAQTLLGLLTRYPQELQHGDELPDVQLRWFEVADWFEDEVAPAEQAGEVAGFLANQFHTFLEARSMTLAQVGRDMPGGLRALSNLLNMLVEAAGACKVAVKKYPEWNSIGLLLDGRKYWVGVNFSEPECLVFNTCCRINLEAATKLGVGEIFQEKWVPDLNRWSRWVDLDSEEIHFYSRSKVRQMEWLEDFLRDCLAKARSIETPDQPPPMEESDES
jgi:hypothetical protein